MLATMKSYPTKTTITYGDAETRGKLRHWKQRLAERYEVFDRTFRSDLMLTAGDMVRGSTSTRQRAYDKLCKAFGPAAVPESVNLQRGKALAVWSILKPRNAVTVAANTDDEARLASLAQDCVTVNYIVVGGERVIFADGLWTLEVPDHALGRAVERSQFLTPEAIIREAHKTLLSLPTERVKDIHYIKAGPGCFAGELLVTDKEATYGASIHVRVSTWLANDMLGADQVPLSEVGEKGKQLRDNLLLPRPLWPKAVELYDAAH